MSAPASPPSLVCVRLPDGTSLDVPVPADRQANCEVKRAIATRLKIAPVQQRLALAASVDAFTVPPLLTLAVRPTRQATRKLVVKLMSEQCVEGVSQFTVQVDAADSVLDLKFLLADRCGVMPDYQRVYARAPATRERVQLRDDQPLAAITEATELRLMFELPSGVPGHGAIHSTRPKLLERSDPALGTMGAIFCNTVTKHPSKRFLGTRAYVKPGTPERGAYEWITYGQAGARVANIVGGLKSLGVQRGQSVGIVSQNRAEWTLTDLACDVSGMVSVPLYDTLGKDVITFICNHASIRAVVASVKELKALHAAKPQCPTLEFIIVMDDTPQDKLALQSVPRELYTHTLSQLESLGAANPAPLASVTRPDDYLTICYTSGTTGNPKGTLLTHGNVVAAVTVIDERSPPEEKQEDECSFSYLPAAHIYERCLQASMVAQAGAIGFSQGDPLKLLEDVQALKPTVFPGVPRVYDRVFARIQAQVAEGGVLKRALFHRALQSKLDKLHRGEISKDGRITSAWDGIVFSNIAAALGGRVKLMASGAAPLRTEVGEFMRVAFMSHFVEGYGMTETCAALTCQSRNDTVYGNVGTPMDCNLVKLVDVPEMGYTSRDVIKGVPTPRGEIMVCGANIFKGYYKQPEVDAEVFQTDAEGRRWFATGDIGMWLPDGSLKIFDRKKAIFKLSQGEYIRAEHIEGVYKQVPEIGNVFVHGDSKESYLVGIVYPEPEALKAFCAAHGIQGTTVAAQLQDPRVSAWLFAKMDEVGKREKLAGFEFVKRITLTHEDFSVDNGLLTPTFKLKRNVAAKHFHDAIEKMYAMGEGAAAKIKAKL